MSNYVQSTNFATKDALSSGDPLKIVKGTEINTEFANIATAIATKADTSSLPTIATTGEAQAGTENTKFITSLRLREGFSASGDAPVYACRAWVSFIGNATPPTILGSGNVASVVRPATGLFEINFTEAMEDSNYAAAISSSNVIIELEPGTTTAEKLVVKVEDGTFAAANPTRVHIAIFR